MSGGGGGGYKGEGYLRPPSPVICRGMSCSKPYCKARSSQITLAIRV